MMPKAIQMITLNLLLLLADSYLFLPTQTSLTSLLRNLPCSSSSFISKIFGVQEGEEEELDM